MQRAAVLTERDLCVGRVGLCAGAFFGECDDRSELRVVAFDAIEIHLRQLTRLDLPGPHELRKPRHRLKCKLLECAGPRHERHSTTNHRMFRLPGERDARRERIEYQRRRDAVVERHLVQGLDGLSLLSEVAHHHRALLVREGQPRDFFRGRDGLLRDVRAGGDLAPQHSR